MGMVASSWRARQRRRQWLRALLLSFTVLVFLLPLVWTLLASFDVTPNNSKSPPTWSLPPTLNQYLEIGVTTPIFAQAFETSTVVSIATTVLTVAISFLAAYALARQRYKGWLAAQGFFILASVPVMAYALSLLTVMRNLRLYDTFAGVTIASSAVLAPLAVYILYNYLRQLSPDAEESARLEGAQLGQILWHIVLPSILPGVAATAVIVFVLDWNLLLVPMLLSESHFKTIPVILTDFFQFERELEWGSAAAVLITSLVPLVVLIAATHRVLERLNLTAAQPLE